MFKIVIIGGMAAGCKAAARLSRLSSDYQITIIERKPFVSYGNCGMPFYAAGEIDDFFELAKTGYGAIRDEKYFLDVKGVNVLTNTEVEEIDTEKCEVKYVDRNTNDINILQYNSLIIATGSKSLKPCFSFKSSPYISSFHSPLDAKNFKEAVQKGKIGKAVIIGGGFIGCELSEALVALWGIETTVIEKENALLLKSFDPEIASIIENTIKSKGIEVLLSTEVEKIELDDKELPVVILKDGTQIKSDYVFYNLGIRPESSLAKKAGIKIGNFGGIVVDDKMKTNLPNIWAAGDCVEVNNLVTGKLDYFSLGSLSNRMGRVAADSIAGEDSSFKGAVGTISLKIFNTTITASGLSEKNASEYGYNVGSVIGAWSDRPDYHPDVKKLYGKLAYEKPGLKLLGLQLIGEGEVTRYIDVFSELLANNKTVYDLVNLEHGYTPAHSSPISPLNYLGSMVINQEINGVRNIGPYQFLFFDGILIDLREPLEVESSRFSNKAIVIPLSDLRANRDKYKLEQPIMFVCEKGPRSYEAARIFMNYGYKNISYLGGGNAFYKAAGK